MTIYLYDLTPTLRRDLSDPAQARLAWGEAHAVATLQGIVNRRGPRLYLRYVEHEGLNIDDWWLDHLRSEGQWLCGTRLSRLGSLGELVGVFRSELPGAVVYDPQKAALSNLASTLAGVENLIAVCLDDSPQSAYHRLIESGPRLAVKRRLTQEHVEELLRFADDTPTGSPKCDAYRWARRELIEGGRCDPRFLAYYIDSFWIDHATSSVANQHALTNHDFFVAHRAFFCDLNCWGDKPPVDDPDQPVGSDLDTFKSILHALYAKNGGGIIHVGGFVPWAFKYTDEPRCGGRHGAVDTEWELVRLVSAYNGFIDADAIGHGAMANASFYMHFPLAERYRQAPRPTTEILHARGYTDEVGRLNQPDQDFVMFYVGDYDSAAWLYQRTCDLWHDPCRGTVPLSWAISPVLCRRAPMALDHLAATRSDNDCFIAADNGAGYLNPSMLIEPRAVSRLPDGLRAWVEHSQPLYEQWDLSITGFVIDGHARPMNDACLEAYACFSPDGVVLQHADAPARLHGDMPVLLRGPDLVDMDPCDAAARMATFIRRNRKRVRFHWCRTILASPSWHARVAEALRQIDSRVKIVGAPIFFELLRRRLRDRSADFGPARPSPSPNPQE